MELKNIHNVYFIGIGGIGMSALARYFKFIGKNVAGYDKTPTHLTDELKAEGINIHFEDNVALIALPYLNKENTLVVVTPAVPKDHLEWNYFLQNEFVVKKRAEVLGIITKGTFCFAVAGTHGKTTTSSILGHILYESGVDVTAFLGGIVENYDSNLIGSGKTVTVAEADEFDRSFLHLHPDIACVTSMDADHLDIYGDTASIEASFREFADKVEDKNHLFKTNGLPIEGVTVGVGTGAFSAVNVRIENGWYVFDAQTPSEVIKDIRFGLPGRHNLTNAMLALAMAKTYGVAGGDIAKALESFKGVRRRFSYQIKKPGLVYIDDYAHHPTEIDAVYQAVTELYPNEKVLAIFQPHLFSRTRDFADGFAKSLSQFENIVLLDIYPARELPIEGVTSQWLLDKIENDNKRLVSKADLLQVVKLTDATVVVTIGAGDIGEMVPDIKKVVDEKV
ncbi:UDP-N-acetylmuramate--alanine ligase [Flavobacterium akiainvivens]|uniref:UDP-N-acetylmuramate--L-alanine ligase n=1 Tax=Flavobacterium akiainvivens TaxID=1202724 RepID=A0A0M9VJ97_9FLAO|nr:UDP-N-acetylmuramate--L-alanine ligase [Flavobacterium akiainvivens]KOS07510.1 UDP-N-acetylmuramate--alanine ligase [Flavobacterium akiainvivens]SFQ63805.1 UDP-N-acetylmuramate--L-alanine ligase [Flavobacterium akiainvivens]